MGGGTREDHGSTATSPDDLTTQLDESWRLFQSIQALLLKQIDEYDRRELYRADGCTNMIDWLVARFSMSHPEAGVWVRTARRMRTLPSITAAFDAGRLSFDQLKPLVKFATPETDAELADEAPDWSVPHLEGLARQLRPVTKGEAKSDREKRYFRHWMDERMIRFSGALPDTDGQTLIKALESLADQAPVNPETGRFEPYDERMADALAMLASFALGDEAQRNADRATVVVHADASVIFGFAEGNGDVEGGMVIGMDTLWRLVCDCRWQLIADGPDGRAVGVGRMQRSVPPWLDRLLRRRDPQCRWPGCHNRGWLDDHHMIHWAHGGATDPDNLVRTCRFHHRLLHEGQWRVEGDPNGELRFTSASGRVLRTYAAPMEPDLLRRLKKRRSAGGSAGNDPWFGGPPRGPDQRA